MAQNYMIGNWKMNQGLKEIDEFFQSMSDQDLSSGNFWIAPQFVHIGKCLSLTKNSQFKIGAQNCSQEISGAFTGEVSSSALKDMGAHFVILGHSERRSYFKESDDLINKKVKLSLEMGLIPVVCCGETLEERESNRTLDIVLGQVRACLSGVAISEEAQLIIAYEPVWAIGTGKTATPQQAEEVHAAIRELLVELYNAEGSKISILYGGSVKPANVAELMAQPNINGGLVGGASLKAQDFNKLCKAIL